MIIAQADKPKIHPFDIEYPAFYHFHSESLDSDMEPFESWDFCFDNGWGVSVMDGFNDAPAEYNRERGRWWIFEFGAWEGRSQFDAVIHYGGHPDIPQRLNLELLDTQQVSKMLKVVAHFEYRTFAARKITVCKLCNKWTTRRQNTGFDENARVYHKACSL